jgi:protocatechuate 3,4-dioxygenase alpha subunit
MIEVWQANTHGEYARAEGSHNQPRQGEFLGFGRIPTNESGAFRFTTVKPGAVTGADGSVQAPHLEVSIFMRGLLNRLVTRIYFPSETANANDPVLNSVGTNRRATLIAKRSASGGDFLEWNVVLQGVEETVFFDC